MGTTETKYCLNIVAGESRENILLEGIRNKIIFFLVDSPLRPLAPPPPRLNGQMNGYKFKKNVIFFLLDNPLPPPLSGLSTKKKLFLRLPLRTFTGFAIFRSKRSILKPFGPNY